MRSRVAALVIALLLARAAGPAGAAPTGLSQIPTIDLVPFGQVTVGVQNGNTSISGDQAFLEKPQPVLQSQFGLSRRIEGGIDLVPLNGPTDYRPQLNLKWDAFLEGYENPGLALGVANVGPGFEPSGYLVFTRTVNYDQVQYQKFRAHRRNIRLRGRRIHVGAVVNGQSISPLVGADIELSDSFVLYADWIAGRQNAASLGGCYVIDAHNSIVAAVQYSNSQHRFNGVIFTYSVQMKL